MPEQKKEKIKVFVSGSCAPCGEVKRLIQEGRFTAEDVDLIDIETADGFAYVEKMKLLHIDEEQNALIITCPDTQE
jgi:hypothetical protein